ncbi:MAG TPA: branched-chain alpha-keto acid dehydrogenase subunit E2 [Ruminococcaceae bacterium]|nr:branched-chain alpha-keto acid dehydrogenase subunit E2 [Oscillospiraceae bacterium]
MGLFNKNNKNKENKKPAAPVEKEPDMSGWNAIVAEFERIYPGQTNPMHFGTLIPWSLGGPNPLDGISIYDGGDFWHCVTFGLSELFEKESENKEYSGYGMEFTFKLKKGCYDRDDEEDELKTIFGNLDNLAKLTFEKGELFLPNEYVYTGQTEGIDRNRKSKLTGFITMSDPLLNTLDTPNGRVEFVEFIGAADSELKAIIDKKIRVGELREKLGTDVTDYLREPII